MQIFNDRVALVTGSRGVGMGRSIAFTLAREGAQVIVNDGTGHPHSSHAAEKVVTEISERFFTVSCKSLPLSVCCS